MWEALLSHTPNKELSYWQKRDIARRNETHKEGKRDWESRVQLMYDTLSEHPGSSTAQLAEELGFTYNYCVRLMRELRDRNMVVEEKRKEVISGITHWRGYYTVNESK